MQIKATQQLMQIIHANGRCTPISPDKDGLYEIFIDDEVFEEITKNQLDGETHCDTLLRLIHIRNNMLS